MICSRNQLLFSNLSQKNRYACDSSNDSSPYFCMSATRNTLVAANNQQRPLWRWFVIGPPSKGILTLNTCCSAILVARDDSTSRGFALLKAEMASLESVSK